MKKINGEDVVKGIVYVAFIGGTIGKMFFDKKDNDKALDKAVEKYMANHPKSN